MRPEHEIVAHAELGEDLATLGNQNQAVADDAVGPLLLDGCAGEQDRA